MLTSLSDIKTYMGIHGNSQDARLTILQQSSEAYVRGLVGNVLTQSYTERVEYAKTYTDGSFFVKNMPVTALTNIGGTAYTGVLNTDYIVKGRRLIVTDLYSYLPANNKFDSFAVTYTAGYATTPEDIKLAIYLMVASEFSKDAGQGMKRVKLGDREVEYDMGANKNSVQVMNLLRPYIIPLTIVS